MPNCSSRTRWAPAARDCGRNPEEVATDVQSKRYADLIERRATGEPLAYVLGRGDFWSLRLTVTPAVLVPRPETELLVERALDLRREEFGRVVDLARARAIALTLASERPGWPSVRYRRLRRMRWRLPASMPSHSI